MRSLLRRISIIVAVTICVITRASAALGASPTAEDALKLVPVQKDIEYDRPQADELPKCTIKAERNAGKVGWVVRDPSGQILRIFSDTNGDNTVDQWSYFKDGLEVYRDNDNNHNKKVDQCRWFNTAGTRWGIDQDEDGKIDQWKSISAEEVTAEVVAALRAEDPARFNRLLLTPQELKSLGLGPAKAAAVLRKVSAAPEAFRSLAGKQKLVSQKTNWVDFGGTKPGLVPAGTADSTADLLVYEGVAAMIETAGQHGQLSVGTLVRVGDAWRLIDVPQVQENLAENEKVGVFIPIGALPQDRMPEGAIKPNVKMQQFVKELEIIDAELAKATSVEQQGKLNARRADIFEQMASQAETPEERTQWLHQLADTVGAAAQIGAYPDGVERLNKLVEQLQAKPGDADLAAYVEFRAMTAQYSVDMAKPGAEYAKIHKDWLEKLEKFVTAHRKSPEASDAMLQLANGLELSGEDTKATKWYDELIQNFGDSASRRKAEGAKTRLDSVGKTIRLQGARLGGGTVDLAKLRGKVVLIHYWSSEHDTCKADLPQLKEMLRKYGKSGLAIVGVSLDNSAQALTQYLKEAELGWDQIFETGGMDTRLANEMGILTLPTMILVDRQGKVVNRNVHAAELDSELKNLLKP